MRLLERIIACVDKIIATSRTNSVSNWKRAVEEGKAIQEEIERLSEKSKEDTESTE